MKTIKHIYDDCKRLQLEYEEERRKAILFEQDRKHKVEEFKQKLFKSRS